MSHSRAKQYNLLNNRYTQTKKLKNFTTACNLRMNDWYIFSAIPLQKHDSITSALISGLPIAPATVD